MQRPLFPFVAVIARPHPAGYRGHRQPAPASPAGLDWARAAPKPSSCGEVCLISLNLSSFYNARKTRFRAERRGASNPGSTITSQN